jgi:hypothetical protein
MLVVALLLVGACADDSANLGTLAPPAEVPAECERPEAAGFQRDVAEMLADLAEQAYDVDERWAEGAVVSTVSNCWSLVKFIEYVDDGSWVDTQLFVAQNKHTGDVVVCFRGSQESTDTWTDISVRAVDWTLDNGTVVEESVHNGFNKGYQRIKGTLRSTLFSTLNEIAGADTRIYFTGHSLGGALTTLAALDLATPLVDAGYDRKNIILYTFGAPRSISQRLTPYFSARVPNAYAVAILRDFITHIPETPLGSNRWEHIPNMVVLQGSGSRTRADQGPGSRYEGCTGVPLPGLKYHKIVLYRERIGKLGLPAPDVWLSVSSDGNMQLHWDTEAVGPCDWVALFRGYPTDSDDHLGLRSWDWAENGNSYTTWWAKGDNYYGAYVNQFNQIKSRSKVYVPTTPRVWLSKHSGTFFDWVQLNWSVSDPGENDYIALYDEPPLTVGPDGYLARQWQWALDGSPWVSGTRWDTGYYIAYIMEDDDNIRRILAWAGPN